MNMSELAVRVGVYPTIIRKYVRSGQITGTKGAGGQTTAWEFGEEAVEQALALGLKTRKHPDSHLTLPSPGPEWISTIEAAQMLGVKRDAIQKRIQAGTLPYKQVWDGGVKNNFVSRAVIEQAAKSYRPRRGNNTIEAPDVTEAELVVGGGEKLRARQDQYKVADAAKILNVSTGALYQKVIIGKVKGQKVQTGPKGWAWYIPHSELERLQEEYREHPPSATYAGSPTNRGSKPRGKYKKREPKVFPTITPIIPTSELLSRKLMDLAELVRANPLITVSRLEVDLQFRG